MRAAIIGATGRLGQALTYQLQQIEAEITALVRTPFKLRNQTRYARIIDGNAQDLDTIRKTVEGQDIVFNTLSVKEFWKPFSALSDALKNIITAMQEMGVSRYIGVAPATILQNSNGGFVGDHGLPSILEHIFTDYKRVYNILKESKVNWVLFCPKYMPDGDAIRQFRTEIDFLPSESTEISVQDVAYAMLLEAMQPQFVNCRVGIGY